MLIRLLLFLLVVMIILLMLFLLLVIIMLMLLLLMIYLLVLVDLHRLHVDLTNYLPTCLVVNVVGSSASFLCMQV